MIFNEIKRKIITTEQWNSPADRRVVFTNGCFDVLHRGHAVYLAKARDLGDLLVVGLNSDGSVRRLKGPSRPVNSQDDRAFLLASLACVDFVIIFDEDTPEQLIHHIRPNLLVKGGDYSLDNIVGADFVQQNGGIVTTIPFVDGYSTTHTIQKMSK